jgi:hypothetical protein
MSTFLYRLWTVLFVAALMLSCTQTLPNDYAELNEEVTISPDYRNLIIPCNIAPLNFKVEVSAEKILVGIQGEQGGSFVLKGPKVLIPEKKWRSRICSTFKKRGRKSAFDPYLFFCERIKHRSKYFS